MNIFQIMIKERKGSAFFHTYLYDDILRLRAFTHTRTCIHTYIYIYIRPSFPSPKCVLNAPYLVYIRVHLEARQRNVDKENCLVCVQIRTRMYTKISFVDASSKMLKIITPAFIGT